MRLDEQPAACVVQPVAWVEATDQVYWHLLYGYLPTEAKSTFRTFGGEWVMIQAKGAMKTWPICILLSEDNTSITRMLVTRKEEILGLFASADPRVLAESASCHSKVSVWCQQNSIEPHVQCSVTKVHKNGTPVRWHWPGPLGATPTEIGIFANLAQKAASCLLKKKGKKVDATTIEVTRKKLGDILANKQDFDALVQLVEKKTSALIGQEMEVVLKDPAGYKYPPHVLVASEEDQWPHIDAVARNVYTFIYSIVGGRGTRFYGEIPEYLDTLMTGSKLSFIAKVTSISFM